LKNILEDDAKNIYQNLGKLNNKFSGKKIFITGGAGFLGKNFINYFNYINKNKLITKPCKITIYDNLKRNSSLNIKQVFKFDHNIKFFKKDISNIKNFPKTDYVIHAASIASPVFYRKFPIETIQANVNGIFKILDYYKNRKVKGILYFSSSEIYGNPDKKNIPTSENYLGNVSTIGPRACYDESKRLGETICSTFHKVYNLPLKIVRPFNNYGPGLDIRDKRVIADLFNNILKNNNLVLYSEGRDTRTFCYISDAIEGYIRTLLLGKAVEPYNIGNVKPEIKIVDLAKMMIKISKKKLNIIYKKNPDKNYLIDNPKRRCPSINKAKKELGFKPKISLKKGLEKTYDFYIYENRLKKINKRNEY